MTKKSKLVPKSFREISGETIDRLIEQIQKNSMSKTRSLSLIHI